MDPPSLTPLTNGEFILSTMNIWIVINFEVCLLAIIVQFMLTLAGLTDSGSQLRTDNVGKIIYCATDPSNPSQYYLDKWAHKGDIDLVSMDDCNSHARVPRDRTEEPFLVIEDSQVTF